MRGARRLGVAFLQPRAQLWVHGTAALVWLALFVPGLLSWRESIAFVIFCSVYANFVGHLSGVAAAAGARKADPADDL